MLAGPETVYAEIRMAPAPDILIAAETVRRALAESPAWAAAIHGTTPPSTLLTVTPRESQDAPYHLVEFNRGALVTARIALADDGTLLEAEGVRRHGMALKPLAARTPPGVPGPPPVLTWQPCDQSTTRLRPFWQYWSNGKEQYIRVDGEAFEQLTITQG